MDGGIYPAYPIDQQGPETSERLFEAIEQLKTEAITAGSRSGSSTPGTHSA
ncbi:hypothetical protein SAMN04487968_11525 [Nocardioides terrae]|uniref:Uncharacterized protein n=1 Tax=Nocardioides terrae TaxID=574651 RepID=A0A1I1N8L1_9ACTN|nr:hypothetical protein [Nocardioides terrae]SFC93795.1 hypothetical protein SAMN04487968_11525 [Nocardioides terrae]